MAITVAPGTPTVITAVSNTVTTATPFPTNPPNDQVYLLPGSLVGVVNPGVAVGGFGLFLQSVTVGNNVRVDFTNNGVISVDQATSALNLRTSAGTVTYVGAGSLINSGTGNALSLFDGLGNAEATVAGTIVANEGSGVGILAGAGARFVQTAASLISTAIGTGGGGVSITVDTGDVEATLDGTIVANLGAFRAQSTTGNITVDFTGALTANVEEGVDTITAGTTVINTSGTLNGPRGIQAVGQGTGLVTVNMSGGQINSTSVGMELVSSATGGVVVDMSGGQIGSATQRSDVGIIAQSNGTAGDLDITVSSMWTELGGLLVSTNGTSSGDNRVTVNGTVDVSFGNGILAQNIGTGDVFVTNNGSIVAGGVAIGATTTTGGASIFNGGTLTGGAGGNAILLDDGDDTLTLAPTSVINGNVVAQAGFDTLQLDGTAGTGTFDVSDIGDTAQYRFFEIFNVTGATWILTGTGTQSWNVLGGTLGGTATIGSVAMVGGTVAPGASAGILSTGSLGVGNAATVAVEIGGINPGAGHDQIAVTGVVALGGALTPRLINGFSPVPGTEFVIIANDGVDAVVDTFAGLAEGALFTAGGSSWRISYAGGDGNDVSLTAIEPLANDFNADFHSDILWRDTAGVVALWEMDGVTVLSNQAVGTLPAGAEIADADGDLDGNGTSDVLFRETDGTVRLWEMNGATIVADTALATLPEHWHIEETGDFNGDGRHDILWHENTGRLVLWEMDGATIIANTLIATLPLTTETEAVADFTGDGRADILLREADGTVRLFEMNGAAIVTDTVVGTLPDHWHIEDTGDFNGDFRTDILWRDNTGTVVMWEMDGPNIIGNSVLGTLPDHWLIADTGDYTGDLRDDILWRDTAGTIALWEMNGPTIVDNSAVNPIPTHWQVVG